MTEELKMDEQLQLELCTKKCANCIYFEQRTCFCRLNPPTPMPTTSKGTSYMTAVYPKISFPEFDFCHQFLQRRDE